MRGPGPAGPRRRPAGWPRPSMGSPSGTRFRARRAWAMAVSGSPSRSASRDRSRASWVRIANVDHRIVATTGGQRALRIGQPIRHPVGLAGQGLAPRVRHAELRVAPNRLWGQGVEPSAHRAQLAGVEVAQRGLGHQDAGVAEVARLEHVPDGLVVIAPGLVPRCRPSVQIRDVARMAHRQPRTEDLREQRVISVPAAFVVEGDDEQVGTLELLQPRLALRLARHGIAKRTAQAIEDGGAQEELLGPGRESREDLLDDVVEDEAVAGSEPMHELGLVVRPLSETAARRSAAAQPSVRSASSATSPGGSSTEADRSSSSASSVEKRRSAARISRSSPRARRRASGRGGSDRVAMASRARGGRRSMREPTSRWMAGSPMTW